MAGCSSPLRDKQNRKVVKRGGHPLVGTAKLPTSADDQSLLSYQEKLLHGIQELRRAKNVYHQDELNGQFSFLRQFTWNNELRALMTEEILDLRQDRMRLLHELDLTRAENGRLCGQLAHAKTAQERLDSANEQNLRLLRELKDLHDERDMLRCELERSRDIYTRLQEVNEDKLRMSRKLGEIMDRNEQLHVENRKVQEENRKLIEMLEDAHEDRDEMRRSLEHATADYQRVSRELESVTSENTRLWERLGEAHEHREKMTDQLLAKLGNS